MKSLNFLQIPYKVYLNQCPDELNGSCCAVNYWNMAGVFINFKTKVPNLMDVLLLTPWPSKQLRATESSPCSQEIFNNSETNCYSGSVFEPLDLYKGWLFLWPYRIYKASFRQKKLLWSTC